jgi:hypothetical protein
MVLLPNRSRMSVNAAPQIFRPTAVPQLGEQFQKRFSSSVSVRVQAPGLGKTATNASEQQHQA